MNPQRQGMVVDSLSITARDNIDSLGPDVIHLHRASSALHRVAVTLKCAGSNLCANYLRQGDPCILIYLEPIEG